MTADHLDSTALQQLQQRQRGLLDDIDRLRTRGIGHHVGLPQLIVCGDQSSGKSSVLDAISHLRFPTDSGQCTRFATEVVLRRDANSSISVSIKPGPSRPTSEHAKLQQFQHEFTDAQRFPALVDEAKKAMGIGDKTNMFTDDVLCVEICGPDKPHLTLVDLPGLIQRNPENAEKVRNLVEKYMDNKRSIILAIVSAENDAENQSIFNLMRDHDEEGKRTLGIVTKPDMLDVDSPKERDFIRLVQNKDTPLSLGWHVLRNRAYGARATTYADRDLEESQFLSRRAWANVERPLKGATELRKRLSDILLSHIERTLPDMISEIRQKLDNAKDRLERLGPSRASASQQRGYLISLSSRFDRLIREASEGHCLDAFFMDKEDPDWSFKRLRAVIQKANTTFLQRIQNLGHKRQVRGNNTTVTSHTADHASTGFDVNIGPWSSAGSGAGVITRELLAEELDTMAEDIRDRSLPGFPNAALVGYLFRDQASPWLSLAESHLQAIWQAVKRLLQLALSSLTTDDIYRSIFAHSLDDWLKERDIAMRSMLNLLVRPHRQGHPITYNPTFLSKIQLSRDLKQRQLLRTNLRSNLSTENKVEPTFTMEQIIRALDLSESSTAFASSDIIASTEAYYEVPFTT